MGAEVVTLENNQHKLIRQLRVVASHLCLKQVGGNNSTAVPVEESESGAEGRGGDTPEDSLSDDAPPSWLCLVDSLVEEVVKEEGFKFRVLPVSVGDVTKEDTLLAMLA